MAFFQDPQSGLRSGIILPDRGSDRLMGHSTSFVSLGTTTLSRSPDADLSMMPCLTSVDESIWLSPPWPATPISATRTEGLIIHGATTSSAYNTAILKTICLVARPLVEGNRPAFWAVPPLTDQRHPMEQITQNLLPEGWILPTPLG
jgi:hypothetical protein